VLFSWRLQRFAFAWRGAFLDLGIWSILAKALENRGGMAETCHKLSFLKVEIDEGRYELLKISFGHSPFHSPIDLS
jgi:hypothetical protein